MSERIIDIDMNSCVVYFNIVLVQCDEAQSCSVLGSLVKLSGPVGEDSCQTSSGHDSPVNGTHSMTG